jgi:hypothetical protein
MTTIGQNQDVENLCKSLDILAQQVLAGWSDDRTLADAFGWNCPALTRHDLSNMAMNLATDIRAAQFEDFSDELSRIVKDYPRRLSALQSTTVQYLYNGNAGQAVAPYQTTLVSIRTALLPTLGWEKFVDEKMMPSKLARKLKTMGTELDQLTADKEKVSQQFKVIADAHSAAEKLPLELEKLGEAQSTIFSTRDEVTNAMLQVKQAASSAADLLAQVKSNESKTSVLVENCEDAYRITTTKGLAGAFEQRAKELTGSMRWWTGGLAAALLTGAAIGTYRLQSLLKALAATDPHWGVILLNFVLSALSVGAPLWFAWLSTKQIGQNFRLREDYAYKSTLAKAYEGYKKEAASLNPEFEARLFAASISRLEEPPLRLIEATSHGSPWHEVINSGKARLLSDKTVEMVDGVHNVVKKIPGLTSESKLS